MAGNASLNETKQVFAIASVFCNRVFVSQVGNSLKITFAEDNLEIGELIPRQSVILNFGDAMQLKKVLEMVYNNVKGSDNTVDIEVIQ